jgi:hypothetical protein
MKTLNQNEWNEYEKQKHESKAHGVYVTSIGSAATPAWIALNKATKLKRFSFENHLSFHVREPEPSLSLSFVLISFWDLDDRLFGACWRAKVINQLSLASITWK